MKRIFQNAIVPAVLLSACGSATADVLCKVKKTGAVIARPTTCTKKETAVATLATSFTSSSAAAGVSIANDISVADLGAVASGADSTIGLDLSVNRLNATGGSINTTGINIGVVGDGGGDSTTVGLSVQTAGADVNYCAIFQGGNVGINVSDPDEALEVAGRFHLGQDVAPSDTTDKLYNVAGTLFWSGQAVGLQSTTDGSITAVNAGTGLTGGGSSGAVTLAVDAGTSAGKIVQLNSSGELPAISGANLTSISATNVTSGTIADSRLSANVSLLGSQISLSGEVVGILPVANGGIGASSLSDLISLGTHTTGDYLASLSAGTGLSVAPTTQGEGAAVTVSLDTAATPTWTGRHAFQTGVDIGTATASAEALHLNGRMHLEPIAAPSTTTDKLYNVGGALFFNGQNISSQAAGGDITSVVAGTGLTGGGTSGAVTLAVDVGTAAGDVVQLNGSAQLPAVSGVNLTALNASNLGSGTVPDARLSGTVSLLGSSINLTSEVTGTLPLANGGIGATSLSDLIALGTHTTGVYVTALTAGSGITVGNAGTEGITSTVSLNQAFAPTWSNTHTFSGVLTDIATASNEDLAIMPAGTGKVGIGTTSPSALLETASTSTSSTAGTQIGALFQTTDTGVVNSGVDTTTGTRVALTRTGATGGTINSLGLDIDVSGDTGGAATTTATGLDVAVSGADVNYAALFSGGNVGIGTTVPTSLFQTLASSTSTTPSAFTANRFDVTDTGVVTAGADDTTGMSLSVIRTGATGGTITSTGLTVSVSSDNAGAGTSTAVGLSVDATGADTTIAAKFSGGSVGIGASDATLVDSDVASGSLVVGNGALCVDDLDDDCGDAARTAGNIYAEGTSVTGIDLAEEFPIQHGDRVEAGDIVVAATAHGEKCTRRERRPGGEVVCTDSETGLIPFVTRSTGKAGEAKRVLGVVSTQPGVTLGGFGREELFGYRTIPLALAGRVPVKVCDENGPIEVGDRITTSTLPGVGRRAEHGDLVVAIALEPFESGQGAVVALVK